MDISLTLNMTSSVDFFAVVCTPQPVGSLVSLAQNDKGVPSLRAGVSVLKFSLYFALKFKKSQKIQNFPKIV